MKALIIASTLFFFVSCNQGNTAGADKMQKQIDSLQQKLSDSYKPGLGEFMSGIQTHHAKLWFAGLAQNWKLADFEIGEIIETIEDVKKYNTDRPEVASIGMIAPAIDSISKAIGDKNTDEFKSGFVLLTNTCNNCHYATRHEFNVIRIPDVSQFSNQDFKPGR